MQIETIFEEIQGQLNRYSTAVSLLKSLDNLCFHFETSSWIEQAERETLHAIKSLVKEKKESNDE